MSKLCRLLIAAPQATANKLCQILAGAGIEPDAVCSTGAQAAAALEGEAALLLTVWQLEDMCGAELAKRACVEGAVMIVPGDLSEDALDGTDVLALRNPISQDALVSAVRAMRHCGAKLRELEKKAEKLERQLAERKVIERAKGKLMDTLHLSERDAHYRMQKVSMDTGRRIAEVAQEILDNGVEQAQ